MLPKCDVRDDDALYELRDGLFRGEEVPVEAGADGDGDEAEGLGDERIVADRGEAVRADEGPHFLDEGCDSGGLGERVGEELDVQLEVRRVY